MKVTSEREQREAMAQALVLGNGLTPKETAQVGSYARRPVHPFPSLLSRLETDRDVV